MASHTKTAQRWLDIALGTSNRQPLINRTMPVDGDRIYSYATHFELARILRDAKGQPRAALLNGDRFSMTTTRHQGHIRAIVGGCHLPSVIIPHEALFAAGVDRDSIEIVESSADRTEEINHVTYEQPEGSEWVEWGIWEHGTKVGTKPVLQRNSYDPIKVELLDDGRTRYSWTTYRHWLGESLVRARASWRGFTTCKTCKGTGNKPGSDDLPFDVDETCPTCRGVGGKHFTRTRWSYYLSGFDHQERRPLYFFCELPRGPKPTTIAEAYEALKPETVKLAEQMNRPVFRQGDIFAVGLATADKRALRKAGARFEKRGQLLNTNHVATEVAYLPDGTTLVRGVLTHAPDFRDPDHQRVRLGAGWHIAIKNTVPVTG